MNEDIKTMYDSYSIERLENYLSDACFLGHIDKVKYLIEEKNVDINFNDDEAIREACRSGNLNVVQYLLTSPTINKHSNVNNFSENGINALASASIGGHLNVVKYLLTSNDLLIKADIYLQDNNAFKLACYRKHDDIIKFLIFDYNIEELPTINDYLKSTLPYDGDSSYAENISRMFFTRTLNNEIPFNKEYAKKVKL